MIFPCKSNLSGSFLNCFDCTVAAFKENLFIITVCCSLYLDTQIVSKTNCCKVCTYIAFFSCKFQCISSIYTFNCSIFSILKIMSVTGNILHIIHWIMSCCTFRIFRCLVCKVCSWSCSKYSIIFFCRI